MNRSYKWPLLFSIFIVFFICLPTLSQAQIIGEGCDYDDPMGTPCPIDGGLGVLIAIGVGYGIKKVKDIRENA
jgi:hypothetical protein